MNIYAKLPPAQPDDLHAPEVGEWGRQKYLRAWIYECIFTTGMKNQYRHRVYIDLFAGAGKAKIKGTRDRVLGSPLLALSVPDPFTKYILCENDKENLAALEARVRREHPAANVVFLLGRAEQLVDQILAELPSDPNILSFCFLDPFDLGLDFNIMKRLSSGRRMDFMVLLAAQMDGQRNETNYMRETNTKIAKLLSDPDWREKRRRQAGIGFAQFLTEQFIAAMRGLRYAIPQDGSNVHPVDMGGVTLYNLLFFSKHERGYDFWRKAMKYSTDQPSLFD